MRVASALIASSVALVGVGAAAQVVPSAPATVAPDTAPAQLPGQIPATSTGTTPVNPGGAYVPYVPATSALTTPVHPTGAIPPSGVGLQPFGRPTPYSAGPAGATPMPGRPMTPPVATNNGLRVQTGNSLLTTPVTPSAAAFDTGVVLVAPTAVATDVIVNRGQSGPMLVTDPRTGIVYLGTVGGGVTNTTLTGTSFSGALGVGTPPAGDSTGVTPSTMPVDPSASPLNRGGFQLPPSGLANPGTLRNAFAQ